MSEVLKEDVIYYANEALNKFGLAPDEITVYIEGRINRSYLNTYRYGHYKCVIVDQTVSDDAFVNQCSYQSGYHYLYDQHYYLCFALKSLKIGLYWNERRY